MSFLQKLKQNHKYFLIKIIKFFEILFALIIIVLIEILYPILFLGLNFNNLNLLYFIYPLFTLLLFLIYSTSVTNKSYTTVIKSVFLSLIIARVISTIISFNIDIQNIIRITIIQFICLAIFKYILWKILKKKNIKTVLICGPEEEVQTLASKFYIDTRHLKKIKFLYYELVGIIDNNIFKYIDKVDEVYLARSLSEKNKNKIMIYCIAKKRINVYLVPKTYEIGIVNAGVSNIDDSLTFEVKTLHMSLGQRFIKRALDIILSLTGLILLSPLFLIIAGFIKIQDKGPVFFKQERMTRYGKVFTLYKFRSMIVDAEKDTGAIQYQEDDPRVTKFGKFLRLVRLDELPQLINVLKSEMSLVGPRALRVEEVNEFVKRKEEFKYRLNVKAGITGFAQTIGNYASDYEDKLRYDLYYIRKYSLWLDILIILYTIRIIFSKSSSKGVADKKSLAELVKEKGERIVKINSVVERIEETNQVED